MAPQVEIGSVWWVIFSTVTRRKRGPNYPFGIATRQPPLAVILTSI